MFVCALSKGTLLTHRIPAIHLWASERVLSEAQLNSCRAVPSAGRALDRSINILPSNTKPPPVRKLDYLFLCSVSGVYVCCVSEVDSRGCLHGLKL
jgi:hypothetical protein